jgi:hypothetical protein
MPQTRKPDFREQFSGIRFPVFELCPSAWHGSRRLAQRGPTAPEYVASVGALHSVTLGYGAVSDQADWWMVTSTARGVYSSSRDPSGRVSLHTNDIADEWKARAALAFAVHVLIAVRPHLRDDLRDDPSTAIDRLPARPEHICVDGVSVEFCSVRSRSMYAAAASVPDGTITVSGRGDGRTLELCRLVDPGPYVDRSG